MIAALSVVGWISASGGDVLDDKPKWGFETSRQNATNIVAQKYFRGQTGSLIGSARSRR